MKKRIAALSSAVVILIAVGLLAFGSAEKESMMRLESKEKQEQESLREEYERIKLRADSVKSFCEAKGYNTDFCFLVDFRIHSGKNRFFVWDFRKDSVADAGLCCHGYGQNGTQEVPVFSNVEGSYCSSLGKYRVGKRAYSQYGINIHYKLHGLDKTNDNAFERWVVLHSHSPVPEREIAPRHLPLGYSQGCPVVSDEMMKKLDERLKTSSKSVLLYIYY